ncbi:MAG: shikimate kinase [Lachnospiraceae bacterium]|nr:shikimate kinase [Lachnospiraceae bacterium]
MKQKLILIGFMGAGKTSVGQACARAFGLPLLDTDQLIEERAGMAISEIFARQGEAVFRQTETAVLEQLLADRKLAVISVGGGLPLREENRVMLKQLGTVVFLRVQKKTVLERLQGDTTRPLLQGPDVEQKVEALLTYRNPIYAEAAGVVVDVDGKEVSEIVRELTQRLEEETIGGE